MMKYDMFCADKEHRLRFTNLIGLAVSQFAFFSNLATLCSRSTSSSTVEVQFQFSEDV